MATDFRQIMQGVTERALSTGFTHLRVHYLADPEKRGDWADRHAINYGGRETPKWRREQEIDYKAFAGQRVWPMLSRKYHNAVIDLTNNWSVFRVIDSGIRHPTVCLWVMINPRGDRHIVKEYYSTDRSIALNCAEIMRLTSRDSAITLIDPETRKRSRDTARPLIDVFNEHLQTTCRFADNSQAGYDAVTNALLSTIARHVLRTNDFPKWLADLNITTDQLVNLAAKPSLTFDLRFTPRSFEECSNLRWQELTGDPSQKSEPEKIMDKDKDGPDCVRYAVQTNTRYRAVRPQPVRGSYKWQIEQRQRKRRREQYAQRA